MQMDGIIIFCSRYQERAVLKKALSDRCCMDSKLPIMANNQEALAPS